MGITLREIVYDIGGGIVDGRPFKAVQTGGPSGGCIPGQYLDMPVDYESLKEVGSIMGSGGMIVMDDSSCMVDVARYFMDFCREESCGKCVPCRVGTTQLHTLLDRDLRRRRHPGRPWPSWSDSSDMVKQTSLCGLGQSAPNPVFSTLRYFRDEYLAHIQDRTCPAGVCTVGEREVVAMSVHTLRIDGDRRGRRRRPVDPGGRDRERHRHPDPVPPGRPQRRRRLPAVRGRGRRVGQAPAGLRDRGRGGHGGDRPLRPAGRLPAHDRRDAVRGAQPHLLGVRGQQPLRAPGPGRRPRARPTSSCRRSTPGSASTPATRCSPSTTTAASCAPAACGSATRSRAPTPGT